MKDKSKIWLYMSLILLAVAIIGGIAYIIMTNNNPTTVKTGKSFDPAYIDGVNMNAITKSYNASSKTITIGNETDIFADITLLTPLHHQVPVGNNIEVAELQFKIYRNVNNFVNVIDYYNLRDNLAPLVKNVNWMYAKNSSMIQNTYNITCTNSSNWETCGFVKNGTKTVWFDNWTAINWAGNIPAGTYKVGIFTDTREGDAVEFIPTISNLRINEWASWNATMFNQLAGYWSFDEPSGIYAYDNSSNHNNAKLINSSTGIPPIRTLGKIGLGYNVTGYAMGIAASPNSSNFNVSNYTMQVSNNASFAGWYKAVVSPQAINYYMLHGEQPGDYNNGMTLSWKGDTKTLSMGKPGTAPCTSTQTTANINLDSQAWNLYAFSYDGSYVTFYVNGTYFDKVACTLTYAQNLQFELDGSVLRTDDPMYSVDEVGFWTRNITALEQSILYNNGSGMQYAQGFVNGTASTPVNITFVSQTPSDISSSNAFHSGVNITYQFLNGTTDSWNLSKMLLFSKVNTSDSDCYSFVNGSYLYCGFNLTHSPISNQSNQNFTFHLDHDDVYPASYNYNDDLMEQYSKLDENITNANNPVKIQLLNVSNGKAFGYFMFNARNITSNAVPLNAYYCNSSYTTGAFGTSPNCVQIYSVANSVLPNFTESNSSYYIIPVAINTSSGKLNNQIAVTSTSQLILAIGAPTGSWSIKFISNVSRAGSSQTSNNAGNSWSDLSGTFDAHIHQFNGTATLWYYAQGTNVSGANFTSALRSDLLNISGMPPTTPNVFSPAAGTYPDNANISINWTASVSPNSYDISNYTVSLFNSTFNIVENITIVNGSTLGYAFNPATLPNGNYIIGVFATDNLTQNSSYGFSAAFDIVTPDDFPKYSNLWNTSSPQTWAFPLITYFNSTWIDLGNNASFNVDLNFNGVRYNATNVSSVYSVNITDLAAGSYNYFWEANDTGGNYNATSVQIFIVSQNSSYSNMTALPASPITYGTPSTFTCSNTIATPSFKVNGADASAINGVSVTLAAGTYTLNCSLASTANYTGYENISTYTITKTTSISTLTLAPASPAPYNSASPPTFTCSNNVISSVSLIVNGTDDTANNGVALNRKPSVYRLNCSAPSEQNVTGNEAISFYTITKGTPVGVLSFVPSASEVNGTTTTVTGIPGLIGGAGDLTYVLRRDGAVVANPDTETFLTIGNRLYNFSATGGENYSAADLAVQNLAITAVPVYPWPTTMFNNSLATENLTFTGNQNITRYIAVPTRVGYVTDAIMNLTGFAMNNLSLISSFGTTAQILAIENNGTGLLLSSDVNNDVLDYSYGGSYYNTFNFPGVPAVITSIRFNGSAYYVGDSTNHKIKIFDINRVYTGQFINVSFTMQGFFTNETDFWVVNGTAGSDTVVVLDRNGIIKRSIIINSGGSGSIQDIDGKSNFFAITDSHAGKVNNIYIINSSGQKADIINVTALGFNNLAGISLGKNSQLGFYDIWASDHNDNLIMHLRQIDSPNGVPDINVTIGNISVFYNANASNLINNRTLDFRNAVNIYLQNCTYINDFCEVPVQFHSGTPENIQYSDMLYSNTRLIENSQSYNNFTTVGKNEQFVINVTYDTNYYNSIVGILNYNNTNYTDSVTPETHGALISKTISIPGITGVQANNSFYWLIALTNGTQTIVVNSLSKNQTVQNIQIDDCSAFTNMVLNSSLYDEDTFTPLTGTIETLMNVYNFNGGNLVATFNNSKNAQSSPVCFSAGILNTTNYSMSYSIRYYAQPPLNYSYEFVNTQNTSLISAILPYNVSLYDLSQLNGNEQDYKVTFRDSTLLPISGAILILQRQYLPLNQFIEVEAPITDTDGQTILHFARTNVIYTVIAMKNGQVLATFQNVKPSCITSTCTLDLNAASTAATLVDYQTYTNLVGGFTKSGNTISFIYATEDNNPATIDYSVILDNGYANETICSSTAYGASGTLNCNVPPVYQNSTLLAKVNVNGFTSAQYSTTMGQDPASIFGGTRVILAMLLYCTIPLMFIASPIAIIIGAMIGMVLMAGMVMIDGGSGFVIGTSIVYFIIAGGIILWRLSKTAGGTT